MKICSECGVQLKKESRGKFCTRSCGQKHVIKLRRKVLLNKWLNGEIFSANKDGSLPDFIRLHLLDEANHQCVKCHWREINVFTQRIPLQINHIDGDWNNNAPHNLEVLCPNCHSLTEFHGSRNKGRGRPYRKKYYNR